MTCTPVRREDRYHRELRFPLLASLFFRRIYPKGKVFVGTTPEAEIPAYMWSFFEPLRADFRSRPHALCRQIFFASYCKSTYFDTDTIFTGCDVLVTGRLPKLPDHGFVLTYRHCPPMPYCADWALLRKGQGAKFLSSIASLMAWMPAPFQEGWGDQMAYRMAAGDVKCDGQVHRSQVESDLILIPSDAHLFTPNDVYTSVEDQQPEKMGLDGELLELLETKTAIHMKGPRKHLFFRIGRLAYEAGLIDLSGVEMTPDELFSEF